LSSICTNYFYVFHDWRWRPLVTPAMLGSGCLDPRRFALQLSICALIHFYLGTWLCTLDDSH
jgi:hypothetical protein